MSEIRWENPPPRGQDLHDWPTIAADLRAHPGRWAMVATYEKYYSARTMAHLIGRGRLATVGAGFEARSRTVDGEYRVYARYVGEGGAS